MTKPMRDALLPCAFCGSSASISQVPETEPIRALWWDVDCDNEHCPMYAGPFCYERFGDAIEAWNTRAELSTHPAASGAAGDVGPRGDERDLVKVGEASDGGAQGGCDRAKWAGSAVAYLRALHEGKAGRGNELIDAIGVIEELRRQLTEAREAGERDRRDANGKAAIEGDCIVIRVTLDSLNAAVNRCPLLEHFDDEDNAFMPPIVTDAACFAKEVVRELNREEEDGTTPIHRVFDAAFLAAVESGAEGILIHSDEGYAAAIAAAKKEQS